MVVGEWVHARVCMCMEGTTACTTHARRDVDRQTGMGRNQRSLETRQAAVGTAIIRRAAEEHPRWRPRA